MTADKRTPHTDALETLGMIHEYDEKRDAIHLAVIPAKAAQRLDPGDHVEYKDGYAYKVAPGKGQGIVDPFLTAEVQLEQRFWFVVYPREIRSLRHVWEHPAFPSSFVEEMDKKEVDFSDPVVLQNSLIMGDPEAYKYRAREWMLYWGDQHGLTVEEAVQAGIDYQDRGEYLSDGGRYEGSYVPEEYWDHFDHLTGRKTSSNSRDSFFSCSC